MTDPDDWRDAPSQFLRDTLHGLFIFGAVAGLFVVAVLGRLVWVELWWGLR